MGDGGGGNEDSHVPYAFTDLSARGDLSLGGGKTLESSALWIRDDVRDDIPDVEAGPSHWGNALARATLEMPVVGLTARHVGVTRFSAEGVGEPLDQQPSLFDPTGLRTDHEVLYWTASTALGPASPSAGARWSSWRDGHGPAPELPRARADLASRDHDARLLSNQT